jgi:hypothetical protein
VNIYDNIHKRMRHKEKESTYFEGNIPILFKQPARRLEYLLKMLGTKFLQIGYRRRKLITGVILLIAQAANSVRAFASKITFERTVAEALELCRAFSSHCRGKLVLHISENLSVPKEKRP